jgi:hypothetical protein
VGGKIRRTLQHESGHNVAVQDRNMSKAYRIVQPYDVMRSLQRAGFQANTVRVGRNDWNQAVVFQDPGRIADDDYSHSGSVLCGHDGKTSLQITPRTVRGYCTNEFTGAPIRIRHTSREMDDFLADPVDMVIRCLEQAEGIADYLQTAQELDIPAEDRTLQFWLRHGKKRQLLRQYSRARSYRGECYTDQTLWGVLQRLTASRSPTLIRLASEAIQAPEVARGDFDGWLYRKLSKGGVAHAACN